MNKVTRRLMRPMHWRPVKRGMQKFPSETASVPALGEKVVQNSKSKDTKSKDTKSKDTKVLDSTSKNTTSKDTATSKQKTRKTTDRRERLLAPTETKSEPQPATQEPESPSSQETPAATALVATPAKVTGDRASDDSVSDLPPIDNLLIRASAGTGKTYQLTSRYLRLLLLGAPAESILATTFTRKAAGEILDRIITWLGEAAEDCSRLSDLAEAVDMPELTQEQCRDKLASVTRQLHRLRIYTIDAFFMQMALSFSLELGMTPGWQILEEGGPESNTLRREAISGVLRQESLEDLLVLVHQLSPKGEAKRGLDAMLRGRVDDAYRLFLDSAPNAWDQLRVPPPLSDDALADVRDELNQYADKRKSIMAAKNLDVTRIIEENWRGFFDGGKTLVRNINEGKEKYGNAKVEPELIALYQRFLPHLRSMILQSAAAQTTGTHRFLEKYHEQYRAVKDNQRLYSFDEVTDLLASHANDPAQLSFRLDAGIDHLLLDEFQDTSIAQWRAFSSLAARCTAAVPGRSFFCVGDVKQAIYGWRGGSSEIFDLLDEKLPNLELSQLQHSRRSSQIIIDAVNRVFEFLPQWDEKRLGRAKRAAGKWDFPEHTTHCRDLPGHFTIETSDEVYGNKDELEESVFRRAAERVQAIASQAKGHSIGILCRRNNKVAQMMNELQRLGVPASEEGGNYLTDSAAVELVLSLLHLTDHPDDTVAAYHLATSPWGEQLGLKVDELAEIIFEKGEAANNSGASHEARSNSYRPPAGIDPKKINNLVRRTRRWLLDDGFGNTIQAWASQLRQHCNRREARRLTQLVEKAYEYQHRIETPSQMGFERQRRQSLRPTEFVRFIRETKVTDPSNATIRVMTVHQAKGLEFDIVILPDLLGPLVDGHDTFLHRRPTIDSDVDLVCRYMGKDSGRSFLPKNYMPLFDQFEDRKARDSFCVLYVAMTRAVHALHVFIPQGMQRGGAKNHSAYLIKDAFAPGVALTPASTVFETGDRHWFMNIPEARVRTPEPTTPGTPEPKLARSRKPSRHVETVLPSQIGASRFVHLRDRLARGNEAARNYGTLIHLWLSQIEWLDAEAGSVPDDTEFLKLAQPFVDHVDVGKALKKFRGMLSTEPLRDILNQEKCLDELRRSLPALPDDVQIEVRVEQPVAGRDNDKIVTGTIDRLILVRAGNRIVAAEIIDFKTELPDPGDAAKLAQKTERYETQMAAYRRAIAASLRIEHVSTRLVFLS